MKFVVGIESFSEVMSAPMIEIPVLTGVEALAWDNDIAVESTEFNAYFESVSVEFDIVARNIEEFTEIAGTEAAEDKKAKNEEKKKKWYQRLWESICNMFKAVGKWFTNAWTWIASKFKKGGEKDVAEAAKEEVKIKAETVEKVNDEMNAKGGLTAEEIKTYTQTIIQEEFKKNKMTQKMFHSAMQKEIVKEVVTEVIKNSEEVTAVAAAPAGPEPPTKGPKLKPKANPTYKFTYWLFNDELMKNVDSNKKTFMTDRMDSIYEDLKRDSNLVHANAVAAIRIVENVASLILH